MDRLESPLKEGQLRQRRSLSPGTRVQVHRTGSFTVTNAEPMQDNLGSLENNSTSTPEQYGTDSNFELTLDLSPSLPSTPHTLLLDLPFSKVDPARPPQSHTNWLTAQSVSSLYKAYERLKSENRLLRSGHATPESPTKEHNCEYRRRVDELLLENESKEKESTFSKDKEVMTLREELNDLKVENNELCKTLQSVTVEREKLEEKVADLSRKQGNFQQQGTHKNYRETIQNLEHLLTQSNDRNVRLVNEFEEQATKFRTIQEQLQESYELSAVLKQRVLKVHEAKRHSSIRRMVRHFYLKMLRQAFAIWRTNDKLVAAGLSNHQLDEAQSAQHERILMRWHHRTQRRSLRGIFSTWSQYTEQTIRHRVLTNKFIMRWRLAKCGGVLRTWQGLVLRRRTARGVMRRLLSHTVMDRLRSGLEAFRSNGRSIVTVKAKAQAAAACSTLKITEQQLQTAEQKAREFELQVASLTTRLTQLRNSSLVKLLRKQRRDVLQFCFSKMKISLWRSHKLSCFVSKMRAGIVHKSFRTWHDRVQESKQELRLLQQTVARLSKRQLFRTFQHWQGFVLEEKDFRRRIGVVVARWNMRHARAAFDSWVSSVVQVKQKQNHIRGLCSALKRGYMVCAWDRWTEYVEEEKVEEARTQAVAAFAECVRRRRLERLLREWRWSITVLKTQRVKISHIAKRWKNRKVHAVWLSWNDWVLERKRLKVIARGVIYRLYLDRVRSALLKWKLVVAQDAGMEGHRQTVLVLQSIVTDLQKSIQAEQRKNLELEQELGRLVNEHRDEGILRTMEMEDLIQQRNKLREDQAKRVIGTWKNRTLALSFNALRHHALENKRNRLLVEKTILRMKSVKRYQVFHSWRSAVVAKRRNRVIVDKFLRRMQFVSMSATFSTWKLGVQEGKRQRTTLGRFLRDWQKRRLRRVWRGWAEFTAESREEKSKMRNAVAWLRHGTLARVFRQWCDYVDLVHEEAAEAKQNEAKLRRAVGRFTKHALSKCFKSWQEHVKTTIRNRAVVQRFLEKWKSHAVHRFFDAWCEYTTRRVRRRFMLKNLIRKQVLQVTMHGFHHWRTLSAIAQRNNMNKLLQNVSEVKNTNNKLVEENQSLTSELESLRLQLSQWQAEKNEMTMKLDEQTAKQNVLRRERAMRVIKTWQLKSLSHAFEAMFQYTLERKRIRALVSRSLAQMQNSRLTRSFESWKNNIQLQKRNRTILVHYTRRMQQTRLATMFRTWYTNSVELKRDRLLINRFKSDWHRRRLSKLWSCWKCFTVEQVAEKAKLQRAVAWMNRVSLMRVFRSWCDFIQLAHQESELAEEHEVKLRKAVSRFSSRTLLRSFHAWQENAKLQARNRVMVTRFISRWKNVTLQNSFTSWSERVQTSKSRRKLLRRILHKIRCRQLSAGFHRWCYSNHALALKAVSTRGNRELRELQELVSQGSQAADVVDKLQHKISNLELTSEQLRVQFDVTRSRSKQVALHHVTQMAAVERRLLLSTTFSSWRSRVSRVRLCDKLANAFTLQRNRRTCSRVLQAFTQFAKTQRHHRQVVLVAQQKRERGTLWRYWFRWVQHVQQAAWRRTLLQQPLGLGADARAANQHRSNRDAWPQLRRKFAACESADGLLAPSQVYSVVELMLRFAVKKQTVQLARAMGVWKLHTERVRCSLAVEEVNSSRLNQIRAIHETFLGFAEATGWSATIRELVLQVNDCGLGAQLSRFRQMSTYLFIVDEEAGQLWTLLRGSGVGAEGAVFQSQIGQGITGRVAASGEAAFTGDARRDPRFALNVDELSVQLRRSQYEFPRSVPSPTARGVPGELSRSSVFSSYSVPSRSEASSVASREQRGNLALVAIPVLNEESRVVAVLQGCAEAETVEEENEFVEACRSVLGVAGVMVGGIIKWVQITSELRERVQALEDRDGEEHDASGLEEITSQVELLEKALREARIKLETEVKARSEFEKRALAAESKLEVLDDTALRAKYLEGELKRTNAAIAEHDRWELERTQKTHTAMTPSVGTRSLTVSPDFGPTEWNSGASMSRSRLDEPVRNWVSSSSVVLPSQVSLQQQEKLRQEIQELRMKQNLREL